MSKEILLEYFKSNTRIDGLEERCETTLKFECVTGTREDGIQETSPSLLSNLIVK